MRELRDRLQEQGASIVPPIHLLAGGPGSDRQHLVGLLREALDTAGCRAPRVAYVGAANGDDAGFFRRVAGLLREAGAAEVVLAPTRRPADAASCRAVLASSQAVFVSGGDVAAGMAALNAAGAVPLLRARHADGVPLVGLSAGSIMLGRAWIAWDDPAQDATAKVFPCLDLAPLICDVHGEEDDWPELRALLARQSDDPVGHGIVALAMLRVHADGRLEAVGTAVHRFVHTRGSVVRAEDLTPRR